MTRHNKQPPREYAIERANATGKPEGAGYQDE